MKRLHYKVNGKIILIYNKLISWKIFNSKFRILTKCRNLLVTLICNSREIQATFGENNTDVVFYIIRCPHRDAGLFAVHSFVTGHIKIAIQRGMIPIVDMKHYPNNYYLDENTIGKVNWWEISFKQPCEYSLEEVYKSKNAILSAGSFDGQLSEILDDRELETSHEIVSKYIRLNESALHDCEMEYHRLEMDKYRVLGVKCRGTDYTSVQPFGHSICPDADATIEIIDQKLEEWHKEGLDYDKIFVATEDNVILEKLKQHYMDRLLYNKSMRFENTGELFLSGIIGKENNYIFKYDRMSEYLITTYCLSKCNALIGPMVNGTLGALRLSDGYERKYIVRLGNYSDPKR